jgi:septal ring factor EnvC (AmiA/AmiB activator)
MSKIGTYDPVRCNHEDCFCDGCDVIELKKERDKLTWERDQAITNMGREFKDAQSAIGVLKAERDKLKEEVERHKEEKRQAHLAFMNSEATNAKLEEEVNRLEELVSDYQSSLNYLGHL